MSNDIEKLIRLIESAENGESREIQYEYAYDEDDDTWVVFEDGTDIEHGRYEDEDDAKEKLEELKDQPYTISESKDKKKKKKKVYPMDTGIDVDEIDDFIDSLNEDVNSPSFWDAYSADTDFKMSKVNGTYCIRGEETGFHYGTHLNQTIAREHVQSLLDGKDR